MTLLALLISTDDSASQMLGQVLPDCGIAVERFSDLAAAIGRLQQQRFDVLFLDFEDPMAAAAVFEEGRRLNSGKPPVTVALVAELARARDILSGGAHFVLYKPIAEDKAKASLRAVTALLNRERRRAQRVPVQAAVQLVLPDGRLAEGILLDLSETGMDVLTAEQQVPGEMLNFRFDLPDGRLEIQAQGQVAWANHNGQTGVHFVDLDDSVKTQLKIWLESAAALYRPGPEETVSPCKLTDLSLGGCYVETDSPFPEYSLVDLCLKTEGMSVHTEGMVRVAHPDHGMGIEFPSRTAEQRAQVEELINFLRSCPESMLELSISPRSLTADMTQFESTPEAMLQSGEEPIDDPLLELLRGATAMQQDDFLRELRRQRSSEAVAT